MTFDVAKLRGIMVEKGISATDMAMRLGINPSTYYRKLKSGGGSFTINQVFMMVEILSLTDAEATRVFMGNKFIFPMINEASKSA